MEKLETIYSEVSLICGHLAIEMNKLPLAFNLLGKLLERNPCDKAALLLLARLYLVKNEYSNVVGLLQPVVKDLKLWSQLSLSYYKLGLFDAALAAISHCKEEDELSLDLHVLQCRVFLLADCKDFPLQVTVPEFEKTLELTQLSNCPLLHMEALLTRAQLFEKHDDLEKCFIDLQDSITILKNPEAVNRFQTRDFLNKTTFTYLYKVFLVSKQAQDSGSIDPLFQESMTFPHTLQTSQILQVAEQLHKVITDKEFDVDSLIVQVSTMSEDFKPLVHYFIARFLLKLDPLTNVHETYKFYQKALGSDPSRAYVWLSIGSLYLNMGQIDDAVSAYVQTIQLVLSSNDKASSISKNASLKFNEMLTALAWFGMAHAYIMTDQSESAIEALRHSLNSLHGNEDFLDRDMLESMIQGLLSTDKLELEALKKNCTVPEISLSVFLNPIFFFREDEVFQIAPRLKKQSIVVDQSNLSSSSRSDSNSNVNFNVNFNVNNNNIKKTVKRVKKTTEPVKVTKFRNKKKSDIFRMANVSISKDNIATVQHKKKQPHNSDNNIQNSASNNNHNTNTNTNINPNPNTNLDIDTKQCPTDTNNTVKSSPSHNTAFIPHQQQHGLLFNSNESNRHQTPVINYHNNISPNTTAIYPYPASMYHMVQPIGFPTSSSLYYPQQSLEEAYRNNSNGRDNPMLPQGYGHPVIMPQFSNPIYMSDSPRFATNPLSGTMIPIMTSLQPEQPQPSAYFSQTTKPNY